MGRGAALSGLLHLAVILLTVLGLPWLYSDEEILQATAVTTISEAQFAELQSKTPPAQKNQDQPKDETIPDAPDAPPVAEPEVVPEPEPEPIAEAEPPPEPTLPELAPEPPAPVAVVPEPEPAPPEPEPTPPEPEPQPQAETAPVPQEQVIAEPQPEPQPEEPVIPPEQQLAEAQPKPVPPKKPKEPKKKEPKKEVTKKEKPEKRTIDQIAEDLKKGKKANKDKKQEKSQKQSQPQQEANIDPSASIRLNSREQDEIINYIRSKCWSVVNDGAPGFDEFSVEIFVQVDPDGSVINREMSRSADRARMRSERGYRSFAEDTLRAFDKCQRIPIPDSLRDREPYERWKNFRIVFHGQDYQ